MAERVRRQIIGWRLGLALAAVLWLAWRLMPAPVSQAVWHAGWPAPDLLLAVACAVVLRRPEFLPAVLIAALALLEDLLTLRPPGLWAALMLVGTEFLRARAAFSREVSLVAEWLLVALTVAALFALNRLVLGLFFVPQPALAAVMGQAVATILAYPAVVGVLRFGLSLRKPATGELNPLGQKL